MLRLFVALATLVCAVHCAHSQGRSGKGHSHAGPGNSLKAGGGRGVTRGHWAGNHRHDYQHNSHRSNYPSSSFGFSIGIGGYPGFGYSNLGFFDAYRFDGYGYDPYRYGHFQVPDLLDDPYFNERHRYDSQFPGMRYRAPLVVRGAVPPVAYESYGNVSAQADDGTTHAGPVHPANLAGRLRLACQQLSHSLSIRPDGEAWLAYLAPHQINELLASGNSAGLRELLTHYDGVVGNPQLQSIVAANGFGTTRSLLRQYVSQTTGLAEPFVTTP